MSLLKLGDWDPDVFFKFRDLILNNAPSCGQKLRNDLCRGVERVWVNYYAMDSDKDVAFEIGRFYYGIREYERALRFYLESTVSIGEHHVTYHNIGLCYYSIDEPLKAIENFRKAINLNSNYEKARNWFEKVAREVSDKARGISTSINEVAAVQDDADSSNVVDIDTNSPCATVLPNSGLSLNPIGSSPLQQRRMLPFVTDDATAVAPPPGSLYSSIG